MMDKNIIKELNIIAAHTSVEGKLKRREVCELTENNWRHQRIGKYCNWRSWRGRRKYYCKNIIVGGKVREIFLHQKNFIRK